MVSRHPNPRALVLRVCLDQACDAVRARGRAPVAVSLDDVTLAATDTPAEILERRNVLRQVTAAVGRLGSRQAAAILMRALHDEPYEAIAQALDCNEATARGHVLRAREKLRRWLGHLRSGAREGVRR